MSDCQVQQNVSVADADFGDDYREWLRPFLMSQRQALLMQVDAIERMLGIEPMTKDLRKQAKYGIMGDNKG